MFHVLSGIIVDGERIDPGGPPVELPAHVVTNLMRAGAIESAATRDLRVKRERALAQIEAEHKAAMEAAIASDAADAKAAAELETEAARSAIAEKAAESAAIAAEKAVKKSRR